MRSSIDAYALTVQIVQTFKPFMLFEDPASPAQIESLAFNTDHRLQAGDR
jgi:hypothetical protein